MVTLTHPHFLRNEKLVEYESLMESWKEKPHDGPTETHHILPRCMGGTDAPENLVNLPVRVHFVAHVLLVECTRARSHYKLASALARMSGHGKYSSPELYEEVRTKVREAMSGSNNPQYGKPGPMLGRKFSLQHKRKISESQRGKIITEDQKKAASRKMTGRTLTAEHRKKISEGLRNSVCDLSKTKITEEGRRKISKHSKERNQGSNHPRARPVIVEGIRYGYVKEAAAAHGISASRLTRWIAAGKIKGRFIEPEPSDQKHE